MEWIADNIIKIGGVAGAISALIALVLYIHNMVIKPLNTFKKEFTTETELLNTEISNLADQIRVINEEHEKQMKEILGFLGNDKKIIDELVRDTKMGHDMLFTMLNSMIDGNGKEKLRKCRQRLIDHHFDLEVQK